MDMLEVFYLLLSHWLTLLAIAITIVSYYVTYGKTYWESKGVLQEKPLPLIGNFKKVILGQCNIATLVREQYNKFDAPYYGISIFKKNVLVVKDPEIIKAILIKDFNVFDNRDFASDEKADPVFFNAVFSTPNPKWKSLRAALSPVFTSGKMKLMFELMKNCGEDLKSHIESNMGKTLEMKSMCSRYTTDVISSCAFGINANSFRHENPEFYKWSRRIFEENVKNAFVQFCYFFVPQFVSWFKLKFIDRRSAQFLTNAFWDTVEGRKQTGVVRNDLVDILTKVKEDRKDDKILKFDDNVMASQAIVFISAGQEASSSLICFALYELALKPNIQDKVRQEILKTVDKHGELTYEGVNEMKYLDMVLQETLRKYVQAPLLSRVSREKYTFEKTGMTIEKGTPIMIPIQGLHFDENYFPNPNSFDPERFNPENENKITPFSYLPFGDGPRNCIGARFGLLTGKMGLIYIFSNFIVETCAETQIPLKLKKRSNLNHTEKGVLLRFKKRSAV